MNSVFFAVSATSRLHCRRLLLRSLQALSPLISLLISPRLLLPLDFPLFSITDRCNNINLPPSFHFVIDSNLSTEKAASQPADNPNSFLNCCLLNARSVCNKLVELNHLLASCNIDILLITESWLSSAFSSSLLVDTSFYSVLRNDRSSLGGGVCAIIRSSIDFLPVDILPEISNLELLAFDVLGVHCKYRFIVSYRTPKFCDNENLLKAINQLCVSDATVVLCGDFNLPLINWGNLEDVTDPCSISFLDCFQSNALVQYVDSPTRKDHFLDLVFTNDPFLIHDVKTDVPLGLSDHDKVYFKLNFCNTAFFNNNSKVFTDLSGVDWDSFNAYFNSVDWTSVYSDVIDSDQRWEAFSNTLNNAILQFAPTSIKQIRNSTARSYPHHIRKLISKKAFLWKKAKSFNTKQLHNSYRECAKTVRKAIYAYTCQLETNLIESNNIGSFYRYVNKKLSSRSGVGCLKRDDGSVTNDPLEKAELLNKYFASVFTVDDGSNPTLPSRVANGSGLSSVVFTSYKVFKKLRNLKLGTACGPDGIQAALLKNASDSLAFPLAQLYQFLFDSCRVPKEWKLATVTPIFKKGKSCEVGNYRPISLTSLCCKIMESIIKDDILAYLLTKQLITRHQHGFLSRRSTGTQLLDCLNDWSLNIENKQSLDVIYIDFAKAFDSVVHRKLLSKLTSYGISGKLLSWIEDFLRDRFQFVSVDGFYSSTISVISGVPQGSVLGPILFIIYINDVCDIISGNTVCKLYADDIKLYSTVDFNGISCDLSTSINNLMLWSNQWQLKVNISKCNVLRLGKNCIFGDYMFNSDIIPRVNSITDLGITINNKLNFSEYINLCVSKAFSRSFLIFRGFSSRNSQLLVKAFITYVRPLLEYNTYIWSPSDIGSINKIERVQRRFTKRIPSVSHLSYIDRLKVLDLELLEYRRLKSDLIMMFKIVHNLVDVDRDALITINSSSITRNSYLKIFKPSSISTVRSNFLCIRCINPWNFLSEQTRSSPSVSCFKNNLSKYNLSSFLTVFKS